MMAATIQRGIGKGRDPWGIRKFLSSLNDPGDPGRSMSLTSVARMADTFPQVAHETARGTRNHRRVLRVLEELGCPREYLYGDEPVKPLGRAA